MAFLDYSGLSHFLDKIKALFVTGPGSSTDAHVATFDGTTGKKVKDSGYTIGKSVPSNALFTDTTYESKSASSGGTDVSLVTTGEKYTWNNKKNTQSAVSDPSASGTSVTFIDSISQDTQGVISPTKKTISTMAGASSSAAGSAGLVPAPSAGDEAKALLGNGTWGTVSTSDMVGATSSAAGTHGLVPAPSAGDQERVLTGGGTWEVSPGAKIFTVTGTVTNQSGAYDHSFSDERVSSDMIVSRVEFGTPNVFADKIHVYCNNGSIRLTCNAVVGTSTVKFYVQKVITDPTAVTSTEFNILNNRISAIENVEANYSITIPVSGWSAISPYTYEWTNSTVTNDTSVEVQFLSGAEEVDVDYIKVDKAVGSVTFTAPFVPSVAIPVKIKITNARAKSIEDLTGEDIATDVVTGAENVDEALGTIDDRLDNKFDTISFSSGSIASNGTSTFDVPDFSDKKIVYINLVADRESGEVRGTTVVLNDFWSVGSIAMVAEVDGASALKRVNITKLSATSLQADNGTGYSLFVKFLCSNT